MKKIEINDLFQSLEKLGINREEIFLEQTLKILQREWKNIVGDVLGDGSIPMFIKDNKLTVNCKHSMISQELEFSRNEILKKLEEKRLPVSIAKIVFRAGNYSNSQK
jgi:hypothetical protein